MRESLINLWSRSDYDPDKKPADLRIECPQVFIDLWAWHKELSRTKQSSWVMGDKAINIKHPVTYQEIQAWKAVMHRNPAQYEIELLLTLDEMAVS